MVAPLQTASLLWVQQAAVILPGNSRSLARQLSSRAVFHHYRSQHHAALVQSACFSRETQYIPGHRCGWCASIKNILQTLLDVSPLL